MDDRGTDFPARRSVNWIHHFLRCNLVSCAGRNFIPGSDSRRAIKKTLGKNEVFIPVSRELVELSVFRARTLVASTDTLGAPGFWTLTGLWLFQGSIRQYLPQYFAPCVLQWRLYSDQCVGAIVRLYLFMTGSISGLKGIYRFKKKHAFTCGFVTA